MSETPPETAMDTAPVTLDDEQLMRLASSVAAELAAHLGVPVVESADPGQPVSVSLELHPDPPAPVPATAEAVVPVVPVQSKLEGSA
ncbi:hypothetical protein AB0P36_07160 [Streptomyces flavidovirens]|uniref:hypothetical protein n=1 Tax=Streptomyces flavidovirens TaxID=67298 RepID=UPI0034329E61